jgi:hypothetical protein
VADPLLISKMCGLSCFDDGRGSLLPLLSQCLSVDCRVCQHLPAPAASSQPPGG